MPTVSSVFRDVSSAEQALKGLQSVGLEDKDIAVVAGEERTVKSLLGDKAKIGAAKSAGIVAGGVAGIRFNEKR
ncbi:hypothetical protein ACFLWX_02950 [Chloroflexota bacterium]